VLLEGRTRDSIGRENLIKKISEATSCHLSRLGVGHTSEGAGVIGERSKTQGRTVNEEKECLILSTKKTTGREFRTSRK